MDKKTSNFFLGLLTGFFFFRKNKNSENDNNKGGCFSLIVWIGIMIIAFYNKWNILGTILLIPLIIGVLIGVLKNVLGRKSTEINTMWELFNSEQYTKAFEIADKYGKKNNQAAAVCGFCYFNGEGCNQNYEKAFDYFIYGQAADTLAKAYYGQMMVYGLGCKANVKTGMKILQEAANKGEAYANLRLGEIQVTGELIPLDVKEGVKNLRKASDDGFAYADYMLGVILYHGDEGVPQNMEQGLSKLRKAAEKGIEEAKEFLEKIEENK